MGDGAEQPADDIQHARLLDGWTPDLLTEEELTPLPEVDRALPIIEMFAKLVGRGRHARYRVAVLRELAGLPRSRLSIRAIQEGIPWMEPSSVTRLVQDLRGVDLLSYDSRGDVYQLSREARVVAAICGALTTSGVDYGRIIKILSATMRLADAMNAPAEIAYATFLSAIAILEFDRDELRRLVDDYSEASLLEAARMAESHVEDMRSLLDEQADMFARFHGDVRFLEHDQRAHHMIASVGRLAAEVISLLSRRADVRLRGALRVDRQDLRKMIEGTDIEVLAQLVRGSAQPPVFLPALDTVAAFTALDDYLGRERYRPVAPPKPADLDPQHPTDAKEDPVDLAASALERLVSTGDAELADWVVSGTWDSALDRMVCAVEAWSRRGPAGDNSLRVRLEALTESKRIWRDGVGWMSVTVLHRSSQGE